MPAAVQGYYYHKVFKVTETVITPHFLITISSLPGSTVLFNPINGANGIFRKEGSFANRVSWVVAPQQKSRRKGAAATEPKESLTAISVS